MLSVVIPVYNAPEFLKATLDSLFATTDNLAELILVDDHSDPETEAFLHTIRAPEVRVTITRNPTHSWTNASWNTGVSLASEPFIAVLNSDITLSPHWDSHLIALLEAGFDCACPFLETPSGPRPLMPIIEEIDPQMLQGACFMFDNPRFCAASPWPIPDFLKHWYGDRYLADWWNDNYGIGFAPEATITHAVSQSAKTTKPKEYLQVIEKDLLAYENFTLKKETIVRRELGL